MSTKLEARQRTHYPPEPARPAVPLLATGGLLGALLASSCCLLPMSLAALGLGGAWLGLVAPLAPWQPWFVALALACLAAGFRLAYRRPAAVCAADGSCTEAVERRPVRALLWLAALLLAGAIAFEPLILPLLRG
jgi:mercuric ion transport protein